MPTEPGELALELSLEDCALCEITYSPVGKRQAWQACEARLAMPVRELHRDHLPREWEIERSQLPCILTQAGEAKPEILLTKDQIAACAGWVGELELILRTDLAARVD